MALRSVVSQASLTRRLMESTRRTATTTHYFISDGKGRILSEEERATDNIYMQLQVQGCREVYSWGLLALHGIRRRIHHKSISIVEEQLDPFSLVADELSILANRLRAMVVTKVPKLSSAAEYFFKIGVEGKRFRPTVLLLMATALNVSIPEPAHTVLGDTLATELRTRQQCIAEIAEMIHVASLLHDDVLDDADTRRGIGSLNFVMGDKLAVLAGDFLLSRACVTLASLNNTEVVTLIATVVKHLVTGTSASLGKGSLSDIHHGIVTAPILFAIEEFPELRTVVDRGFDRPADVDLALDYLGKSHGIQKTRELAMKHANLAAAAVHSLPESDDEEVLRSRRALVDLTHMVITRNK